MKNSHKHKKIGKDAVTSSYQILFLVKNEIIYLVQKKRLSLSFFLLKIFEFYFCPGNYA